LTLGSPLPYRQTNLAGACDPDGAVIVLIADENVTVLQEQSAIRVVELVGPLPATLVVPHCQTICLANVPNCLFLSIKRSQFEASSLAGSLGIAGPICALAFNLHTLNELSARGHHDGPVMV
jgi:hypothetical protein